MVSGDLKPQIAQIRADYDGNRDPETYAAIGAAMEVHRTLGPGFLEAVYQEAFEIELRDRNIPHAREQALPVTYKSRSLETTYKADFVCFGSMIVELKAVSHLDAVHEDQLINYLKATRLERGLLFNFANPSLQYKRFINQIQSA
jgi:GxxExxY protein